MPEVNDETEDDGDEGDEVQPVWGVVVEEEACERGSVACDGCRQGLRTE